MTLRTQNRDAATASGEAGAAAVVARKLTWPL